MNLVKVKKRERYCEQELQKCRLEIKSLRDQLSDSQKEKDFLEEEFLSKKRKLEQLVDNSAKKARIGLTDVATNLFSCSSTSNKQEDKSELGIEADSLSVNNSISP